MSTYTEYKLLLIFELSCICCVIFSAAEHFIQFVRIIYFMYIYNKIF